MFFVAQRLCAKSLTLSAVPIRIRGFFPAFTTVTAAVVANWWPGGVLAFPTAEQPSISATNGSAAPARSAATAHDTGSLGLLTTTLTPRRRRPARFVPSRCDSKLQ